MRKQYIIFLLLSFFTGRHLFAQNPDTTIIIKKSQQAAQCYERGSSDSSKKLFVEVLQLLRNKSLIKTQNDFVIAQRINAMDYLSSLCFDQGQVHEAISYADTVLKYFESQKDSFNLALSLNNIGYMYQGQSMYDKALENYRIALNVLNKNKTEDAEIYKGILNNNIGLLYEEQHKYDSTLKYYGLSLTIRRKIDDKRGMSESLNNIGNTLRKLGRTEEALAPLLEALELKRLVKDGNGLTFTLNNLAIIYHLKGDIKKSQQYALESLESAERTGNVEALTQISRTLGKNYFKLKDYKNAYVYLESFIKYNDSLINVSNKKALYKHQIKSEFEKKEAVLKFEQEKKDAVAAEQFRRQRLIIYSVIIGLILLLLVIIFIYKGYRDKKRSNIELTNKNEKISQQKHVIEEKSKEILDSITYAKRIQTAILPPDRLLKKHLPESFVLYLPKDIVAGDFYWMEAVENENSGNEKILIAAADCTGHGVPGAMVSVICNGGLNRAVREFGITDPGKILDKTRELVIKEFEKSDEEVKDGMDISLCSIEKTESGKILKWAGANNPLWIIQSLPEDTEFIELLEGSELVERRTELVEVKADKQPIGKYGEPKPFTTHVIEFKEPATIYFFTDGYQDQFGGEKGKKYKAAKLKELLLSIQDKSMEEQKEILHNEFLAWRGDIEQIDDVCVIGIRL